MSVNSPSAVAAMLLLALSLGLKLAVQDVAVGEDGDAAVRDLGRALARQGYSVSRPDAALPIVHARREGCAFTARVLDPHGTFRDMQLAKLPRGSAVTYAWDGRWHAQLPRAGPLTDYFVAREVVRIGGAANRRVVVMLSGQPGCPRPAPAALDIRARLQRIKRANRATPI